ncbi:zeta toxin family protein [Occallatibacter savannae]|uniref:zeta toxin family protein n=1 Tax=Occallatibacter savannae TaxID=1002691 RepID=UPI000D6901D2|nr:zeta toxin family protein [Occallatibacter savannae]
MEILDRRPIIIAIAGPNGAGKTTFYRAFLASSGLYFVNADLIAKELNVDPYRAAEMAGAFRQHLLENRASFVFETVFSDPAGDKLHFLKRAEALGYTVALFFIGLDSPEISDERVSMRVSQGGHDVPQGKLFNRYPRVLRNLKQSLAELSNIHVYDNSDLLHPYRLVLVREDGGALRKIKPVPDWLAPLLPKE